MTNGSLLCPLLPGETLGALYLQHLGVVLCSVHALFLSHSLSARHALVVLLPDACGRGAQDLGAIVCSIYGSLEGGD